MSLAKIKNKEAKGKQKVLPKLKTILANPLKKRSPTLSEDELAILQSILQTSISNSGLDGKKYVTAKHIHLGLESGLRAINNQQSSCVFISLSIKPSHIASLVARNAEIKDEIQPVYAQPRLEDFTEKLFGIRTLCMVLPKTLEEISCDLCKWVEQRRKPKNVKEEIVSLKKIKKKLNKIKTDSKPDVTEESKNETETPSGKDKESWKGDYISFGKGSIVNKDSNLQDENAAIDTLSRIMDNIPKVQVKTVDEVKPMDIVIDEDSDLKESKVVDNAESDDSVDFLGEYKSLVVHKIKPNPNKKPKKKRNKNKLKNKDNKK
ncbi:uncharacterized protein LOC133330413 [Musca vetustissima]|uniref:uncharacterized protein LOC133330413 n=1 Tax=Musca vetustissima TaxID=27455 RepID=UPI002AB7BD8E|nr:uncharacterized protein LOC133330413 [Musca vetustissima]